jgi:hypothetical protein
MEAPATKCSSDQLTTGTRNGVIGLAILTWCWSLRESDALRKAQAIKRFETRKDLFRRLLARLSPEELEWFVHATAGLRIIWHINVEAYRALVGLHAYAEALPGLRLFECDGIDSVALCPSGKTAISFRLGGGGRRFGRSEGGVRSRIC